MVPILPASVGDVARDPLWLPHRYDPGHDAIHFRRLDRAGHDTATFLIDADLPAGSGDMVLRRDESAAAAEASTGPLHFVFHSAYCCSTLIARALSVPGVAMGLKEPQILNDVVGWRRRDGETLKLAVVLDDVLKLLAQPFSAGETVVVKPSNVVNAIAPFILAQRPAARALLLYAPLSSYLASIIKKGMTGALWVREHFIGAVTDGIVDLGFSQSQFFRQTDLQIAAMGWLAQHMLFAKVTAQFGPDRVRSLDVETLLANKERAMLALAVHFNLHLNEADVARMVEGPAFTRHSKNLDRFDVTDRFREQAAARHEDREEIEKVATWTAAVAEHIGLSLQLGLPLLS